MAPEVNINGLIFSDFVSGSDNQKKRIGKHANLGRNEEQGKKKSRHRTLPAERH